MARDALGERLAVDQLEDERANPIALVHAVDRADVRVIERREQQGLAIEPRAPLRAGRPHIGEDLDRHVAPKRRVVRLIDLAHPAGAEQRLNRVRSDPPPNQRCAGRAARGGAESGGARAREVSEQRLDVVA